MTKVLSALEAAANWDGRELEIATTPKGLAQLSEVLRHAPSDMRRFSTLPTSEEGRIRLIEVQSGSGLLSLRIDGDIAVFTGSVESFALLARNLENLSAQWQQGRIDHFHFDPSSDTLLLDPDSEAFIFGRMDGETDVASII